MKWLLTFEERRKDSRYIFNDLCDTSPAQNLALRLKWLAENQAEGRDLGVEVVLVFALQIDEAGFATLNAVLD